jgi:hypothetical protein
MSLDVLAGGANRFPEILNGANPLLPFNHRPIYACSLRHSAEGGRNGQDP